MAVEPHSGVKRPTGAESDSDGKPPTEGETRALASIEEAFDTWQVIGEGSAFLTLKLDFDRGVAREGSVTALALDGRGAPLRQVTGWAVRPDPPAPPGHLWLFLVLYAPQEIPEAARQSELLGLGYTDETGALIEKRVPYAKTWYARQKAKISDLPAPPDEIEGVLVLKDYTFLARGDARKPDGYYVAGKIVGGGGRWAHLEVTSGISGEEPLPEVVVETGRGWLELSSGATHGMQEAVAPAPPYVTGWWDGKGYFHPDPLRVH